MTIDGEGRVLSANFTVCATQNPIEYEGTYPLPEAQLDRFMFKLLVRYPEPKAEDELLQRYHRGFDPDRLSDMGVKPVTHEEELARVRQEIQGLQAEPSVLHSPNNSQSCIVASNCLGRGPGEIGRVVIHDKNLEIGAGQGCPNFGNKASDIESFIVSGRNDAQFHCSCCSPHIRENLASHVREQLNSRTCAVFRKMNQYSKQGARLPKRSHLNGLLRAVA